jgi:hypothetical protein
MAAGDATVGSTPIWGDLTEDEITLSEVEKRHREAVTSRPMLLGGVARHTKHAGQSRLHLNLSHAQVDKIKQKPTNASLLLCGIFATAKQLSPTERWRRILAEIFEKYLEGRPLLRVRCQHWPAAESR